MRHIRLAACLATIAIALVLLLARPHTAQEKTKGQKTAGKPLDISYVTDDFFAAIVVHPARLWKSAGLKELPLDQAAAAMKEHLGLEPRQIEQVMILLPRPTEPPPDERFGRDIERRIGVDEWPAMPLPLGGVIRLNEPVAKKELVERAIKTLGWGELEAVERAGKTYWKTTKDTEVAIYLSDERTIVFGGEPLLGPMILNLAPGGKLAGLLRKAEISGDVLAVVDPSPLREMLAQERRFAGDMEDLILRIATQLLRRIEAYSFSADFSEGSRLRWEIAATSEADAELLHDLIRGWQAALKLALPAILEQLDEEEASGIEAEIVKFAGRLATEMLTGITTSRKEDRVVLQLDMKGNYAELLATAAKTVAAVREEGTISQSAANMRQLGLAIHLFHDVYNTFPAHAIYEADETRRVKPDAKPLLSWRVAILPFIEAKWLYDEFHHDEPWDSPHNKKLIAKMPFTFKTPGHDLGEGKTCYVLPIINDERYATMIPQRPGARVGQGTTTFGSIIDGTSNTIMIVEAAPEKAVIWTKPDDWEVDVKKSTEGLFGARKGFALAVMGDSSVRRISEKARPETLLRALGRADGEQVDFSELAVSTGRATKRTGPYGSRFGEKTKTPAFPRPTKTEPYRFEKTKTFDFREKTRIEKTFEFPRDEKTPSEKTFSFPRPAKTAAPRRDFKTEPRELRKTE